MGDYNNYPGDEPFPFGPVQPDDCLPNNSPFGDFIEKLPEFDHSINIPSVFTPIQPSMLEILKALRDTFEAINVPTTYLDALISKYDFEITFETTNVDDEQLEANRNIAPQSEANEFGD